MTLGYIIAFSILLISTYFFQKDVVTVALVEDDELRNKVASDDYTTVVFKYKDIKRDIDSTDENEILQEIVEALPKIEMIGPDQLRVSSNVYFLHSL